MDSYSICLFVAGSIHLVMAAGFIIVEPWVRVSLLFKAEKTAIVCMDRIVYISTHLSMDTWVVPTLRLL